jgi:hypothetical protein
MSYVWGHALNTDALIFAIATALLALLVIELLSRSVTKRVAERIVAELRAKRITPGVRPEPKPASDFVVEVSDAGVTCSRPDGKIESIQWDDLQSVAILSTDEGPFAPDQFWLLSGATDGCVIPWGVTGDRLLLDRLQRLPGFRNEVIVGAANLTTNNLLLCWERTPGNP